MTQNSILSSITSSSTITILTPVKQDLSKQKSMHISKTIIYRLQLGESKNFLVSLCIISSNSRNHSRNIIQIYDTRTMTILFQLMSF